MGVGRVGGAGGFVSIYDTLPPENIKRSQSLGVGVWGWLGPSSPWGAGGGP